LRIRLQFANAAEAMAENTTIIPLPAVSRRGVSPARGPDTHGATRRSTDAGGATATVEALTLIPGNRDKVTGASAVEVTGM